MEDDSDAGGARPLAGDYVLTAVRRRIRPRRGRAADCPACGGYLFEDEWHLAATVAWGSLAAPETATHYVCSSNCLEAWLGCYEGIDGAPDGGGATTPRR